MGNSGKKAKRVDSDSGLLAIIDPSYLKEAHNIDGLPAAWYDTALAVVWKQIGGTVVEFRTPTSGLARAVLFRTGIGPGGFVIKTKYKKDGKTPKRVIIDLLDNDADL